MWAVRIDQILTRFWLAIELLYISMAIHSPYYGPLTG